MYILEGDRPFGFIAHPKTASRACREALEGIGAVMLDGHHYVNSDECKRIRDAGGTVCSVVRNPFDVMVSWYFFCHRKENNAKYPEVVPFVDWVPGFMEHGNSWIERGLFYGLDECNQTMRHGHNLGWQLSFLLDKCGLPPVQLEIIGASDRGHYSQYYDQTTALLVRDYCMEELEKCGYHFEMK